VVSNPPYVKTSERPDLAPEVLDHDPPAALFAGEDGLAVIGPLIERAAVALRPGGRLAFEHGCDQAEAVAGLLGGAPFEEVACHQDLAGRPRVTVARRRP
jgi:release factor glutamine methyltransferase